MGRRTLEDCAEQCAMRKKCTAFDLSRPKKAKFDCLLYGHRNVTPAYAVKGECYSLRDR